MTAGDAPAGAAGLLVRAGEACWPVTAVVVPHPAISKAPVIAAAT